MQFKLIVDQNPRDRYFSSSEICLEGRLLRLEVAMAVGESCLPKTGQPSSSNLRSVLVE